MNRYFGKYRGTVMNNVDPMQQGRTQVSCPAVLGDGQLSWAMPCVPFAGPQVGLFAVPPTGALVWVEFEGGNPDYPILAGGFWGPGQAPASPAVAEMVVLKTGSSTLTFSDIPGGGGVTLEVGPPAVSTPLKMTFDSNGIKFENGAKSVAITPANVKVNDGALEVM